MKIYEISIFYEKWGEVLVKADSKEEAIEILKQHLIKDHLENEHSPAWEDYKTEEPEELDLKEKGILYFGDVHWD